MGRHSLNRKTRRRIVTGGFAATVASCAFCVSMSTSMASAAILPPSVLNLLGAGIVTDDTRTDTGFTDYYPDSPEGTIEVVTPGTDDTGMRPRIDNYVGGRTTLLVNYAQSFWPIIPGQSGKLPLFAPEYDESKEEAEEGNLVVMEELSSDPNVVFVRYSGYSQGADALGNALERAVAAGIIDKSKTVVVLTSDPRGPWGLKQGLDKLPLVPTLAALIGAEIDGARNPADTEDVPVEAIIVTADPVGNWQWKTLRPLSSLAVNAAGFIGCHSDPACYGNLLQYDAPTEYKSVGGNTTYKVYRSLHPFTLLRMSAYKDLGLEYTADDVARWEKAAQTFYAIEEPSANNSAVPVYAVTTPMTSTDGNTDPVVQTSTAAAVNQEIAGSTPDSGSAPEAPAWTPPVTESETPSEEPDVEDPASASSEEPDVSHDDTSPTSMEGDSSSSSENLDDSGVSEDDASASSSDSDDSSESSDSDSDTSGSDSSSDE